MLRLSLRVVLLGAALAALTSAQTPDGYGSNMAAMAQTMTQNRPSAEAAAPFGEEADFRYSFMTSEPEEVQKLSSFSADYSAQMAGASMLSQTAQRKTTCELPAPLKAQIEEQLSHWSDGVTEDILQKAYDVAPAVDAAIVRIRDGKVSMSWKQTPSKAKHKEPIEVQLQRLCDEHELPDTSFVLSTSDTPSTKGSKLPIFSTVQAAGDFDILYPSAEVVGESKSGWVIKPEIEFNDKKGTLCWRGTLKSCEYTPTSDKSQFTCGDKHKEACGELSAKIVARNTTAAWSFWEGYQSQYWNDHSKPCVGCDLQTCKEQCAADTLCTGFVLQGKDCHFRSQSPSRLVRALSQEQGQSLYIHTPLEEHDTDWSTFRNADSYAGVDYKELKCDGCTIADCKHKCTEDSQCTGFVVLQSQCYFKFTSANALKAAATPSTSVTLYVRSKEEAPPEAAWQDCSARTRLVGMAKQYPDKIDAGFVSMQNEVLDAANMDAMRRELMPHSPLSLDKLYGHKYLIQMDGEAGSWQFPSMLASSAAVLKQESDFTEFYSVLLKPNEHYLAVRRDLSNLPEQLQWLQDHNDLAGWIASNSKSVVTNNLQHEQITCYWATVIRQYASRNSTLLHIKAKDATGKGRSRLERLLASATKSNKASSSSSTTNRKMFTARNHFGWAKVAKKKENQAASSVLNLQQRQSPEHKQPHTTKLLMQKAKQMVTQVVSGESSS